MLLSLLATAASAMSCPPVVVRVIAFEPSLDYKNGAFRMPWLN